MTGHQCSCRRVAQDNGDDGAPFATDVVAAAAERDGDLLTSS